MAFNDKINDNLEEMFNTNNKSGAQQVFNKLLSRAVLNWTVETNLRYVKGREGDLGIYKPGFLIECLSDNERKDLKNLRAEELENNPIYMYWTP